MLSYEQKRFYFLDFQSYFTKFKKLTILNLAFLRGKGSEICIK